MNKLIKKWCDENDIDFDIAYKDFNETYNKGYEDLGRREVVRPFLNYMPGKIGGHCVVNNCKLFNDFLSKFVIGENNKL